MKFYVGLLLTCLVPYGANARCSNESLSKIAPSKFLIYHTDKEHKVLTPGHYVSYERHHDEYSDMSYLYEISHKKDLDKKCTVYLNKDAKNYVMKQKDFLNVRSAEYRNKHLSMKLDHPSLSSIECDGVQTVGDLRDVVEPYLSFTCKDSVASTQPKPEMHRLPASVTAVKKTP